MSLEQAQMQPWEMLEHLVDLGQAQEVEAFLESLPPGETAHTIVRMGEDKRTKLLELLPAEPAAFLIEALSLVHAADMIEELPAERAAAIVDEMDSDEQTDLLAELHENDAEAILEQMSPEEAQDVRRLSRYGPDTAGGIMITEFLSYSDHLTIDDVISDLRRGAHEYDVQYLYIIGTDSGQLCGVARLRELVLGDGSMSIKSIILSKTHRIQVSATLDDMEDFFDRHEFLAAPVVDEDDRLVGVVRRANVEEALGERADKAMLRIGGIIGGEELRTMAMAPRALRRLAFLIPNIGLNLIAVSVIALYEPLLVKVSALMIFLPILSDMSGCSGNQAVAVSMRELALGVVKPFEAMRVLFQEAAVGLLNGLVLGVVLGMIAWLMRGDTYPYLGWVVGSAMVVNCFVSVCIGGTVPLLLKAIKVDPALASGPILTTITDLGAFFFALSFAKIMLEMTGSV